MPARRYEVLKVEEGTSDVQLVDELDVLLERACDGDDRALLAVAMAFGPRLIEEARAECRGHEQRAADAVAALVNAMGSGALRYESGSRRAVSWMVRMVRRLALKRRSHST